MDKESLQTLQEIREMEDKMTIHLITEFESLLDNTISSKQAAVLEMIYTQHAITPSELASALNITTSAVSQLLNRLEENNYIKRTINKENRRKILIELDAEGISYFEKVKQIEQEITMKYYTKLGKQDLQELHRLTKKLLTIMNKNH